MQIEISDGIGSLLIIEDEGLVSMMIEEIVLQMGATDVRVCADLATATTEAETASIDGAVLDMRIRGGDTAPIADILAARGIPFMFSTGGDIAAIPERHRHRPRINKPFAEDEFRTVLLDTLWGHREDACATPVRVATLSLTE